MKIVSILVCGGSDEDYDFLLGCLDRNLSFGNMIVLDTSPTEKARRFLLPSAVKWIHKPDYGHGWTEFRFRDALNDAIDLAEKESPDVIVHLDADEYFDYTVAYALEFANKHIIEVKTLHHVNDREALDFPGEWHRRLWPANRGIRITRNVMWENSPHYNGNPQYHPALFIPEGIEVIREFRTLHHHLHYAIGEKANDYSTARNSIDGWPDKAKRVKLEGNWPSLISLWKSGRMKPSNICHMPEKPGKD